MRTSLGLAALAAVVSASASRAASQVPVPIPTTIPVVSLSRGASCACAGLRAQFRDDVLYQHASGYQAQATDFWDVRSSLAPHCIFLPADADQVATAVSIIASCGAQFAVRAGGHMNSLGANNINGGVLLGLNRLTDITISDDNSTVELGPGIRWVDAYGALEPRGLYAIGGRLKTIGISGLSLIGGFHYFNNKYGFTMDQHVSYDVVLGNGTRVVADANRNPELFWALKGGAGNFGVVTKFTMKTVPIPLVSTTIQQYNETAVPAFLKAVVDLTENNTPEVAAGAVLTVSYNATTKRVGATLLGVEEGTVSPQPRFTNFSAIPSTVAINNVSTPLQWHSALDSPFQMFRIQFAMKSMKPDYDQILAIYHAWKDAVDEISDIEGLYPTLALNPMYASAHTVAKTNGIGNTWGLPDDQSYLIWQLSTGWANAADDIRIANWARSFVDYWHLDSQSKGLSSEFLYMGDTSAELQDPFLGIPLENVQRMRVARETYDPLGVFSRLNWGGFKLGP